MNDLSQKRELHDQAKELYDYPAFKHALERLRTRYVAELVAGADTTERKLEIIASMKALDAIPGELKTIMNDYTMAKRQDRHA